MTDQPPPPKLPPTLFGTTYLTEHITSMFADEAAARAAVAALTAAGFSQDNIIVGAGEQLLRNEEEIRDRRTLADRVLGLFPSDERQIVQEYAELAEQGYAVVAVPVPESEPAQRQQAADILRQHGGVALHYYGKLTVTDL